MGAEEVSKKPEYTPFITFDPNKPEDVPAAKHKDLTWQAAGKTLTYRAQAGHTAVRSNSNQLMAEMFTMSYQVLDGNGKTQPSRPVTFLFNGGPGCASVPINFGGMGPRRVVPEGVEALGAKPVVEDNPHTLLKESDLVFLDAPGTGWSGFAEGFKPEKCFGVDGDADAFARAIIQWLTENDRWDSPVFIFGESYGTFRNAVLMRYLGERGVHLAGVVMLSSIFDWAQTLPGNDLYFLGMVPTFAAAAQFFGKAGKGVDEDAWFDQACRFTEEVYAPALLKGDRISHEDKLEVATAMSQLIGLDAQFIMDHDLRIDLEVFRVELLRRERKVIGRLDMRFSTDAPASVQVAGDGDADPANDALDSAWTMAFRNFCTQELDYAPYAVYMSDNYEKIGVPWDWNHETAGTGFKVGAPNVSFDMATALRRSPKTHLALLGGRYDAATTFWNTIHDMANLFLSDQLKAKVHTYRYGCGHMAYADQQTLEAMDADLHQFYAAALA